MPLWLASKGSGSIFWTLVSCARHKVHWLGETQRCNNDEMPSKNSGDSFENPENSRKSCYKAMTVHAGVHAVRGCAHAGWGAFESYRNCKLQ